MNQSLQSNVPFPPEMRWMNSLDTPEKVTLFTSSNTDFGRDVVYLKGEADEEAVYMGKGNFKLTHCLHQFNSSRVSHQIIMVFEDIETYKKALETALKLFQSDWFWVHFNIQRGPKSDKKELSLSDFKDLLPDMRKRRNQVSFGLTATAKLDRVGGYEGSELSALANKTDDWYAALEYDRQFMVELNLYLVVKTTDRMRFLKPFVSRSMLMNFEAGPKYHSYIVANKGILRTMANSFGPERIYMNIPEEMRKAIDPSKWKPKPSKSRGTARGAEWNLPNLIIAVSATVILTIFITE